MMKGDVPSKKKISFKIKPPFRGYLKTNGRVIDLPLQYRDLLRYVESTSLLDAEGNDTLWETVYYTHQDQG